MKRRKLKTIREAGKIRMDLIMAAGMREEAIALDHGNQKDGRTPFNWRTARVLARDQAGGAMRHLVAWLNGEDFELVKDKRTGKMIKVHHLGALRARANIILDAQERGTLIDDRVIGQPRRRR